MKLSIAPVVGIPDGGTLPVAFQHVVDDGRVVLSAVLQAGHGRQVREILAELLDELRAVAVFSEQETGKDLREIVERYHQWIRSAAVGVFFQDSVTVVAIGGGAVLLARGEKRGRLLQSKDLHVITGQMVTGDQYVFLTEQAYNLLAEDWPGMHESATALAEEVAMRVQASAVSPSLAAIVAEVHGLVSVGEPDQESSSHNPQLKTQPSILLQKGLKSSISILSWSLKQAVVLSWRILRAIISWIREQRVEDWKRPKKLIPVVLVVVGLLILGAWVSLNNTQQTKQQQAVVDPLRQELERLKMQDQGNHQEMRERASALVTQIEERVAQTPKKSKQAKLLTALLLEAQTFAKDISGKAELDALEVFFNFQLLNRSFIAKQVEMRENTAWFMDPDLKLIVELDLSSKQSRTISIESIASPALDLKTLSRKLYVLADDGVYEVSQNNVTKEIDREDAWVDPRYLGAFGENLYVYDAGAPALWRYAPSDAEGESFGSGTNWIRSAQGFMLDGVTSLSIDGSVWLASQNGQIAKFVSGSRDEFEVFGMMSGFTEAVSIFVPVDETEESGGLADAIYVLDRYQNRIVQLNKQGAYLREWQSSDLGAATELVVNLDLSSIFVAGGSQVFRLPL